MPRRRRRGAAVLDDDLIVEQPCRAAAEQLQSGSGQRAGAGDPGKVGIASPAVQVRKITAMRAIGEKVLRERRWRRHGARNGAAQHRNPGFVDEAAQRNDAIGIERGNRRIVKREARLGQLKRHEVLLG